MIRAISEGKRLATGIVQGHRPLPAGLIGTMSLLVVWDSRVRMRGCCTRGFVKTETEKEHGPKLSGLD